MTTSPRRTQLEEADEATLVRDAQRGDSEAFAEIVRRHQRSVFRVAFGLTRRAEDADDLAQETFVRAYRALGTFRVGEPLHPWLARIAVNLAYSLFRRRKRRPETPLEPLLEEGRQWAAPDDPVEEVIGREQKEQIRESFAGLKPEHQTILVLRVVEGLSYGDIALALGIPPGTVMSRLSRARAELKARLETRRGTQP